MRKPYSLKKTHFLNENYFSTFPFLLPVNCIYNVVERFGDYEATLVTGRISSSKNQDNLTFESHSSIRALRLKLQHRLQSPSFQFNWVPSWLIAAHLHFYFLNSDLQFQAPISDGDNDYEIFQAEEEESLGMYVCMYVWRRFSDFAYQISFGLDAETIE